MMQFLVHPLLTVMGDSVDAFCDDTSADAAVVEDAGPWAVNMWSGIARKACRFADGEVGVHLKCRPSAMKSKWGIQHWKASARAVNRSGVDLSLCPMWLGLVSGLSSQRLQRIFGKGFGP